MAPELSENLPALTIVARIGFVARGTIYLLVAIFAAAAALGWPQRPHGITDVVQAFTDTRLRLVLAALVGVGLACLAGYFALVGLWQCSRSRQPQRWLRAAGMLGDALIYAAVMVCVLGTLVGWHPDGEQQTQAWIAWLLTQPYGRVFVGIAGLLIFACGVAVVVWATTSNIDADLDMGEDEKRIVRPLARYGLAGRGIAISLVGLYWIAAAIYQDPSNAHELGGALQSVQQRSVGWVFLLVLAVAFAASAVFDFIEGFYHRADMFVRKVGRVGCG